MPFPSLHSYTCKTTKSNRIPKQFSSLVSSLQKLVLRQQNRQTSLRPFISPTISKLNHDNNSKPLLQLNVQSRHVAYYEITILKRDINQEPTNKYNKRSSKTSTPECIALGISTKNFNPKTKMPGWDNISYAYHSDDGGIYHNKGTMISKYGPTFGKEGDVIGCGINYKNCGVFFTLNGRFLGYAWKNLGLDCWYPTIGIDVDCPIYVNFGNDCKSFDFDFDRIDKC